MNKPAEARDLTIKDNPIGVYEAVKAQIIQGHFAPSQRLNIEAISMALGVSATPVREALCRMISEDLVSLVPRVGFFLRPILESDIRELYELNHVLLNWAIDIIERESPLWLSRAEPPLLTAAERKPRPPLNTEAQMCDLSSKMFLHLAYDSGNETLVRRLNNVNDRLALVRKIELQVLSDPESQILALSEAISKRSYECVRRLLSEYIEARFLVLRNIAKALRMADETRQSPA